MKLSVLDQSVISKGDSAGETLRKTVELAQITEDLGYTRFWVAEHHNTNGIAGSSPEVLISHIASRTRKIRVGSGGVLLPQYSPYKVAENFKVLEALFPNRIDAGLGRSPGGSATTRLALTDGLRKSQNEFPRQVKDLQGFFKNDLPGDHPYQQVKAYPEVSGSPELWLLGITHRGARLAAENGTAFTYGHFITPVNGKRALEQYYREFQPSPLLDKPKANVCVFVVCAETQEKAEELALSQDLWLLRVEKGMDTRIPSLEEARNTPLTVSDRSKIIENRKRMIIGTPEKIRNAILKLSEVYSTEEFMIINNLYSFEDKVNTYTLLADALL
ncbi:LLM class flavin-dependent oxidoreductase [Mesobacillus selenatarsenatis]|uniref:Bacterial luciferase family protein n=1 Tax=Mesobacillus selenatarsenatis (strain DSM 18680 / JCM 14380 / FERM P-15431 / SF-1) TaxID=1321606 RepID=A0A0A8X8N0_MESS1|nr:LLM class flavin-dependent oxidoreductase [Mesobacillus selenatarsenatis]GAM15649.1 bacterial luciferase family protein [Mesobacillus selenatarsenatis SF-1]